MRYYALHFRRACSSIGRALVLRSWDGRCGFETRQVQLPLLFSGQRTRPVLCVGLEGSVVIVEPSHDCMVDLTHTDHMAVVVVGSGSSLVFAGECNSGLGVVPYKPALRLALSPGQ